MKKRIRQSVEDCVSYGTQYIRAQIDCTDSNLRGIKAVLEVRDELKDKVTNPSSCFPTKWNVLL